MATEIPNQFPVPRKNNKQPPIPTSALRNCTYSKLPAQSQEKKS